ncbi:MAG TPA: BMP family ABC transporter substrate-binding protein [Stellaceae bacterium]|nr:BMP family ABC transporter substrate-binding protein [Stellaceae bacterium]
MRILPELREKRHLLFLALLVAFAAPAAAADDTAPGIVYAQGAKFDKSFNEAAYTGAERFKAETGIGYHEVEITNDTQRVQALSTLIRRGAPVVVAVGFDQRAAVETVADRFPEARLVIIDTVVDKPNVQSVVYREQEGAFLVGVLGAMATKSGTIGYLGGMDIPIVRRVGKGYAEGARWAVPGIAIIDNVTGTTPAAFVDPARGAELARSQFDRGVDVIFAAAGMTGFGALQAAKDAGKLAIGMDSNQNPLFPGTVLTSLLKRVDNAVYDAFVAARAGTWQPGIRSLGITEHGVDYAMDDNNAALVTPQMREKAEAARAEIIAGRIRPAEP